MTAAGQGAGLVIMGAVVLVREACASAGSPIGVRLPPAVYLPLAYWVIAISGISYWL